MNLGNIQYDTAELKVQWSSIEKSRMRALDYIVIKRYSKVMGLDKSDPQELFRFAVGFTEQPADLTENHTARKYAEHFRRVDPEFAGSTENEQLFRKFLGTPTLLETNLALANRSKDDAELAKWLTKLLAIYNRGRITQDQLETSNADKTASILLLNWLIEPFDFKHSLAFFSDRAMAKIVYYLTWKKPFPLQMQSESRAADRVRKVYLALGLRPADKRAVKDIIYQAGGFNFIPFNTRTPKGR